MIPAIDIAYWVMKTPPTIVLSVWASGNKSMYKHFEDVKERQLWVL